MSRVSPPSGPESPLVRSVFGVDWLRPPGAIEGKVDAPDLDKANPYHDERGRFSTAGAGGRDLSPETQFMVDKWSNGYHPMMRAALSGDVSHLDMPSQIRAATLRDGARLLLKEANDAPPTKYSLYRGIGVTAEQRQQMLDTLKPGATVDLNLASWTKSQDVARQFASNSFNTTSLPPSETFRGTGLALHQMTFAVDPGAHALDVTNLIPQGPSYSEHLMAGRFEVTAVTSDPSFGRIMTDGTRDTIHMRQVGTLDVGSIVGTKVDKARARHDRFIWDAADVSVEVPKYSESQPRDDHGRFAADGGGSLTPQAADEKFGPRWSAAMQALPNNERTALAMFKTGTYLTVNDALRGLGTGPVWEAKTIDAAMQDAPRLTEPLTVYRGLREYPNATDPITRSSMDWIASLQPGARVVDKGFPSTSASEDVARKMAEAGNAGTIMRISLPAGTRAWYMDDGVTPLGNTWSEAEFLLPRDGTYTVTGRQGNVVDATYEPAAIFKYSDTQPRVPSGVSEGGQFAPDGGGSLTPAVMPESSRFSFVGGQYVKLAETAFTQGGDTRLLNPMRLKAMVAAQVGARLDKVGTAEMLQTPLAKDALDRFGARNNGDVGPAVADFMHDKWALTSGDHDVRALALQRAVTEEFGLHGAADAAHAYELSPTYATKADEYYQKNGGLLRAYARAEYENTQDFLRSQGIDHLNVYRGVALNGPQDFSGGIQTNALSSWTTDAKTAQSFSGGLAGATQPADDSERYVFGASVPASRIFSTAFTGTGCLDEQEVVMLGGTDSNVHIYQGRATTRSEGTRTLSATTFDLIKRKGKAPPVYIDAWPGSDWPKRTNDTIAHLQAATPKSPSEVRDLP